MPQLNELVYHALAKKDFGPILTLLRDSSIEEARKAFRLLLDPYKTPVFWRHLSTSVELLETIAADDMLYSKLVETAPAPVISKASPEICEPQESIPEEMILRS